jgi:hypothetical protein
MVAHTYNPSYLGSRDRKITIQGGLGKSARPIWKRNWKQKDWRHGSSGRALASGPEFSPQYYTKNQTNKKTRLPWITWQTSSLFFFPHLHIQICLLYCPSSLTEFTSNAVRCHLKTGIPCGKWVVKTISLLCNHRVYLHKLRWLSCH